MKNFPIEHHLMMAISKNVTVDKENNSIKKVEGYTDLYKLLVGGFTVRCDLDRKSMSKRSGMKKEDIEKYGEQCRVLLGQYRGGLLNTPKVMKIARKTALIKNYIQIQKILFKIDQNE